MNKGQELESLGGILRQDLNDATVLVESGKNCIIFLSAFSEKKDGGKCIEQLFSWTFLGIWQPGFCFWLL